MSTSVDSTKARILEAAGNVFAHKGFEAATIREICQAAAANLAAVNYHFGDKQRLYIETVKHAHCSRAEQVPLPDWDIGTPPADKLRSFVAVLLERMLSEDQAPWHAQLMLREIARPNFACEELVRDFIRPHFEKLKAVLRELVPGGMADDRLALTAFSVIGQCLFYRVAQPVVRMLLPEQQFDRLTHERLAEHISDVILAAVGYQAPAAAGKGER